MGWFTMQAGGSTNPQRFFNQYGLMSKPYTRNTITWASGYGAKYKRVLKLPDADVMDFPAVLRGGLPNLIHLNTTLAPVLGALELHAQKDLGLRDRAGLDFAGAGDPTQMDCVDEAWNATASCLWLQSHGALRGWSVHEPLSRWSFSKWNHYGALLVNDADPKLRAIIDGGVRAGGLPPLIIEERKWYV